MARRSAWRRWKWQMRMMIAECGLYFWFNHAAEHVGVEALEAFSKLLASIPKEPPEA